MTGVLGAGAQQALPGLGPAVDTGDDAATRPPLDPEDLRDLLGVPYTDEQLAAATAPLEPAVVIAGAGSGKTSVMAARVVWLVATRQVEPGRVLGLTFTNKAAAELAGRVRLALRRAAEQTGRDGWGPPGGGGRSGGQHGGHEQQGHEQQGHEQQGGPGWGGAGGRFDGGAGETPMPAVTDEPTISTYHAYAGRLVGEHALRLGLEPDTRMLVAAARYQLAARVVRTHGGRVEALTRSMAALVADLVALDGELSEHLVSADDLMAFDADLFEQALAAVAEAARRTGTKGLRRELRRIAATARARRELAALVADYRAARRAREVLDFGDQVTFAARLAGRVPPVGEAERARFGVVLLDEYQDTSVAQRTMLAGLFGGGHPVTAVGDPCQAIYGWRGASVANLDNFPDHFPRADGAPAARYRLSVNQRSGGRLLVLANDVAAPLRARHHVVELRPRADVVAAGRTLVALHASWAEEVTWVAARLAELAAAGERPGNMAVLVRARSDVRALHTALTAAGLPVEVVGLAGLLDLPEVTEVVTVLEVLDSPIANAALVRLLTGPRVRLGPRDLAALGRRARGLLAAGGPAGGRRGAAAAGTGGAVVDPLAEAVAGVDPCDVVALADALADPGDELSAAGRERVIGLAAELAALRAHVSDGLLDLLNRVISTIGLDVEISASPKAVAARRRENLASFLDVAADFDDPDGPNSLTSFLAFLGAAREHERGLDITGPTGADAVALMTVHRAKGLEWEVVAVPDLSRAVFPDLTVRDRWTTSPGVLPTPLRGDADELPSYTVSDSKAALATFTDDCRDYQEREERRLAYVAFTRAKSVLLGSGHWWGPTQRSRRGPSVFLTELRDHAEAGHGNVDVWTPEPPPGGNPDLAVPAEFEWPMPYEPVAYARRQQAASAVREALDLLRAGQAPAPDDLAGMTPRERALLAEFDREAALLLAEERAARAPFREVAIPTSLTASEIVRMRADPAEFARELARPVPRRPVPQARRGTRFHAWVEEVFDQRPLIDVDDLPDAADAGSLDDHDLAGLQDAFLAGPYGGRRPFAVEAPFEVMIGGRAVRGRIDAVYDLGDGRWEVVDWKTGSEPADPVQLAVYRVAWARVRGVGVADVDAAYFYVTSGQVVRPPLLAEEEIVALLSGQAGLDGPGRTAPGA
ncbi:DNA helicase-2 / ATP-dependent DNA helicase PcrA [Frankia sp. EI5c]|uniref:ATP-dependent DNA helicase n=1 Tax=Frankia sp. EI5c TaxID=683316 RepID=UPI0007C2ECB7|nr:ATP-dependent DNA helicase [Frankia sp. EI5c]OAA24911.1 DNA helicase-2 / ATP-dependent DNA helicase PcrA [Frankia sp. EI5c]